MYTRLAERPSSPTSWTTTFDSRSRLQENLSLWRLRAGVDTRWRAMAPVLEPNSRILDVGCGLGTWARFLIERDHLVCGVDYSVPLLSRAKGLAGPSALDVCAAVAEALPFANASLDSIISWGVIEHDEEGPNKALREFRRVLKPGGRVFVTVPLDSPREREADELIRRSPSAVFYEYHFTLAELADELDQAGFVSVTATPVTRSPHLAAPRLYRWLAARPAPVRDTGIQLLKSLTLGRSDCFHMVLGSGAVPNAGAEESGSLG